MNVWLLGSQDYSSPFWVSFKQAKQLGGTVRKGEQIPLVRFYSAFNIDQCDGIRHARLEAQTKEPAPFNPIEAAEAIVASYPYPPSISHDGGASAYYRPATDSIHLPKPETFDSEAHFYGTLLHEIGHSTGSQKRLARPGVTNSIRYGSHEYALEELVAEMSAAFLLAEAGINCEGLIDNSASYIASWIKSLRDDPKLVVRAGAQAQKAVDYVLDRNFEPELHARAA